MAWTQAQLDSLEAAIASGRREVSYDGRMVKYASLQDMLFVRGMILRALGASSASDGRAVIATNKGLGPQADVDDRFTFS